MYEHFYSARYTFNFPHEESILVMDACVIFSTDHNL